MSNNLDSILQNIILNNNTISELNIKIKTERSTRRKLTEQLLNVLDISINYDESQKFEDFDKKRKELKCIAIDKLQEYGYVIKHNDELDCYMLFANGYSDGKDKDLYFILEYQFDFTNDKIFLDIINE